MDSTLTNEEREALDLEEEKRRKVYAKEMENAVAYYLMIKYGKIELQKNLEFQKQLFDGILHGLAPKEKKEFPKNFSEMAVAYECAVRSLGMMHKYFACDLSAPENAQLKEDMKAANVTEDQFATLAFCACGNDIEKFIKNFDKKAREGMIRESGGSAEAPDKADEEELGKIRDQGILAAKSAISQYKNGDMKLYAKILGDALLVACTGFAREPEDSVAMQWSVYAGEIVRQFEAKKELIKHCHLTEKHFDFAQKVTSMGLVMARGLKLSEKLGASKLEGKADLENNKLVEELNIDIRKFEIIKANRPKLIEELFKIQQQTAAVSDPVLKF